MLSGSLPNDNFDARVWLQTEFTSRQRKNARFSLRAFARLVDMDASTVSQLLSGKRKASRKVLNALCDRLSARPEVRDSLLAGVSRNSKTIEEMKQAAHYHLVAADTFAVMADWYHFAILDMPYAQGFRSDPEWIARKLSISVTEARVAIDRLIRLGLFEIKNGRYVKTQKFLTNIEPGATSTAHRELQRQILQQALQALDHTSLEERDSSAMTMAINPAKLPEAKKRIKKFRRELCELLETGARTRIYQLAVQLFPVSALMSEDEK